ncbi:hypothetical protein GH714_040134 [Hevea brasiliensis]|uniref:PB1-like domain-containing protein n=1 Tax=Hevea brasiliensis TaxID=3981 RepID=A0A6A6MPP8_HEVBR|nr:hypothetical protein GH714_040134 [Hevea brasiliensis]
MNLIHCSCNTRYPSWLEHVFRVGTCIKREERNKWKGRVASSTRVVRFVIGGILVEGKGNIEYEGGEIFYWENRYIDLISYLDIEDELKMLGYRNITKMAYFILGMDKKKAIRYVRKYRDVDVLEILKWDENGDIYLFVEAIERQDYEGVRNNNEANSARTPNKTIETREDKENEQSDESEYDPVAYGFEW